MAGSERSDCAEKRPLICSKLEISDICGEMEQSYKLATLVMDNFYNMKNDIDYILPLSDFDGELRFTKKRNYHIIKITADFLGKVSASVLYETIKTSKPFLAEEVTEGEHVTRIPSNVVESPQNAFLKEGRLIIHFKLKDSANSIKRAHACSGRREKYSQKRLSEDMKSLSIFPSTADIILHVDDRTIRVPRGLLAARSDYFKHYPDSDNNIYLNTYYETVSCALRYLYSGKIPDIDELTGPEILRIFEVAGSLKINSLRSKCSSYFNEFIIRGDIDTRGVPREKLFESFSST